ncbi:MAG: arylsulfatase [Planctomycetota bacterium]|jgi:arylsulfatase
MDQPNTENLNRRQFLRFAAAGTAVTPFLGCQLGRAAFGDDPLRNKRPNIILIITDDQGYGDLSCHGNPVLKTPNLDALHAKSVRFTNFHVSPTCAPTRSALFSGRHEFKNGVTHTLNERERMSLETVTLADTLKKAGYATGIFGKWHLGDQNPYQPDKRGFDEVFIHGAGGIGQRYPGNTCADAPPNQQNRYFDPVIKHNGTFVKTKGFCTDVFFRQALGWINKKRAGRQPFFAYITTNAPHGPYIAPDKYKQPFLNQGLNKNIAGFYGMIVNIDDNIKLLMDKNLEQKTLLIFMTDNGSAAGSRIFNAGMKGKKGNPNEGGTRVPAFFRWTSVLKEGVDVDRLTAHIDMYPTLAELAGARLPASEQVEGRSLFPLLKDPDAKWKDRLLFTHVGRWPKGADPNTHKFKRFSVRSERFRLVGTDELYDMDADPGQKVNVIDKYPKVAEKMLEAYKQWWKQTLPLMVNEKEPVFVGKQPFVTSYEEQLNTKGILDWIESMK